MAILLNKSDDLASTVNYADLWTNAAQYQMRNLKGILYVYTNLYMCHE